MSAASAFDALHPSLRYHLVNSLRWPSLRPLQEASIPPLLAGEHALLLAPTAGGKTEAAALPLLSRMLAEDWPALAVLYVCPLRALLDNLAPRLEHTADLLGRRVGVWHGDVSQARKAAIRRSPPDLLLTTPESLEGLLVSSRADPGAFFHRLRAVVVDEIHAFAGDDRGWHLLAVLERIGKLAGRELQRIGLSATVGNPEALLEWLAGACGGARRLIVDPGGEPPAAPPEVQLDWVGNLGNAARLIAALHRGEKTLVFCDSRSRAEELAHGLGEEGLAAQVSHSSLGRDLRRAAERAFTETPGSVIVATSTLELGIDVGDLDRVIQIDAPGRVASFLQRLGRTGRRPGSRAGCLFLATHPQAFLRAAAILQLWSEGYVEPVTPPAAPFHVLAQQLMALCLQESGVAFDRWRGWLMRMPGFAGLAPDTVQRLVEHLFAEDILWRDGGRIWLGAEAERRYRRRNFMELLSMITDSPLFTVYHGRQEVGQVDRASFVVRQERPPVLLLAGRGWQVEHVDWRRKRCWVRAVAAKGRSRWLGEGQALSFELCQAMRRILRGDATPPGLTRRGSAMLEEVRDGFAWLAATDAATVFEPIDEAQERWWTFAGLLGNATVLGLLRPHLGPPPRYDNLAIVLPRVTARRIRDLLLRGELEIPAAPPAPEVDRRAIEALKFGDCLPEELVRQVVAARLSEPRAARHVLAGRPAVHCGNICRRL